MFKLLCVLALVFSLIGNTMADEAEDKRGWAMTGFLSKHVNSDKDYNEQNHGIGYKTHDGYLAGLYRNSLNKNSLYAGKEFQTDPLIGDKLRLAIVLGLVSGYGKPVQPLALPEVLYGNKEHELALGIVPPIKGVTPMTAALQYRKRF